VGLSQRPVLATFPAALLLQVEGRYALLTLSKWCLVLCPGRWPAWGVVSHVGALCVWWDRHHCTLPWPLDRSGVVLCCLQWGAACLCMAASHSEGTARAYARTPAGGVHLKM
jgi:hypothetical protein